MGRLVPRSLGGKLLVALALFSKRLLKKSGIRRSDSSSLIASNGMGGLGVNEGLVKLRLEALCVRLVPEFGGGGGFQFSCFFV